MRLVDRLASISLVIAGLSIGSFLAISWMGCSEAPGTPAAIPESKVAVMAFVASWCEPCKEAKAILIAVRFNYAPDVYVLFVDIDEYPMLAEKFKVASVPTFFIRVGKEIKLTRTQDISVVVRIVKENMK